MFSFYFVISVLTAVLAIAATVAAEYSMRKGLTYSAMRATVWTLGFIAVSRLWHVARESFTVLEGKDWAEITEYSIYAVAYVVFIFLVTRARDAKINRNQ